MIFYKNIPPFRVPKFWRREFPGSITFLILDKCRGSMENHLVRKSNYLVEAAYRLSAVEQKIILVLASMIKTKDREFKPYMLRIRNFSRLIELDSKADYEYLKSVTRSLLEKVFVIRTPHSEIQTHWLSSVEYNEGKGSVAFTFDPKLRPFLLQLKERFTTYRLRDVIQLRSSFSIRMYELLKEYENIGSRTFELKQLKEVLGLERRQYTLYGDFKKRVILPAQKELKAKTDITFEFEEIKTSRAVTKLRFQISANANYRGSQDGSDDDICIADSLKPAAQADYDRLEQLLPEKYRSMKSVQRLVLSYLEGRGVEYVARNIAYANAKSNAVNHGVSKGRGSNYRNYLAIALHADFGLPFIEDLEAQKATQAVQKRKEAELADIQQREMEKVRRDQENMEIAGKYQKQLAPAELAQLREEAFDSLDDQQKSLVLRNTPGSEMLLKIAMTHICMARMKVPPQQAV